MGLTRLSVNRKGQLMPWKGSWNGDRHFVRKGSSSSRAKKNYLHPGAGQPTSAKGLSVRGPDSGVHLIFHPPFRSSCEVCLSDHNLESTVASPVQEALDSGNKTFQDCATKTEESMGLSAIETKSDMQRDHGMLPGSVP